MRQSSAWVMSANGQMLAGSHAFQTRELVERALESAALPFKGNMPNGQLDSDEEFETNLRRELIEIALVNGVSDVETLRDILIATRSEVLNVDPLRGDQRISLVQRRNRLSSSSPSLLGSPRGHNEAASAALPYNKR